VGPIEMHESAHPTEQNQPQLLPSSAGWAGGAIKKGEQNRSCSHPALGGRAVQ
jgi:hypothetical protein